MLPPDPGTWNVSLSVTGTKFHIEHVADDEPENPQPYWHVQDLIVSEVAISAARGLGANFGLVGRGCDRIPRSLARGRPEAAYGFPPGVLTPFSHLGLVDVNLAPKAALAQWDVTFARLRR